MSADLSDIIPEIPLGKGVKILGIHAEGLVALEKPTRILSHPNVEADRWKSLLNASWSKDRERYMWKVGDKSHRFYLLHRLDSATSGVILGCINPNLSRELKGQFSKRKVSKSYHAVVMGLARENDTHWKDLLRKRRVGSNLRMDATNSRGSPAETHVKILQSKKSFPKLSLLRLHPRTGRTHQLRVQSAKRQLPIVGDSTYGDFSFNRRVQKAMGCQRLFLHASSIRIFWDWQNRQHEFLAESPLPGLFQELMDLKLPSK